MELVKILDVSSVGIQPVCVPSTGRRFGALEEDWRDSPRNLRVIVGFLDFGTATNFLRTSHNCKGVNHTSMFVLRSHPQELQYIRLQRRLGAHQRL